MSGGRMLVVEDRAGRRRRSGSIVLLFTTVTAAGVFALAASVLPQLLALGILVMGVGALIRPDLLAVFVGLGQFGLALVLLGLPDGERWLILPFLLTLVVAAELLAGVSRLDGAVPRPERRPVRRVASSAALAGTVCLVVLFVGAPFPLAGPVAALTVLVAGAFLLRLLLRG